MCTFKLGMDTYNSSDISLGDAVNAHLCGYIPLPKSSIAYPFEDGYYCSIPSHYWDDWDDIPF